MLPDMKRRRLLTAAGLTTIGAVGWGLKPSADGAPHNPYFQRLSAALKRHGMATPTLVIDRQAMLANAKTILGHIDNRMQLRLVVKSLPSLPLLDVLRHQTKTDRLMLFSLPQLQKTAHGKCDILLGKPMPIAAAAEFYRGNPSSDFVPDKQLQWLIDSPERLAQYRDLARGQNLQCLVNFEIDVGLHRGGINSQRMLQDMLAILKSEPRLRLSGLMGYDAHITKIPNLPGLQTQAREHARALYASYASTVLAALGNDGMSKYGGAPTFNAAGSPTYRLYDGKGIENELSVGSAMLKASDFDTPLLADLVPAVFIATPVLKTPEQFMMPFGVEWTGNAARMWDANQRKSYFIYGGNWLADPCSPSGLHPSGLYGTSSNQQVLLGSGAQQLRVDDIVFFRPRQSEAVLLQFGDIAVFDGENISEMWAPMPATA
ncbi:MAG: alanine racemase [Burkholderiales bacterium]|nr:alanine racemase [Burkholderiales bacterium]